MIKKLFKLPQTNAFSNSNRYHTLFFVVLSNALLSIILSTRILNFEAISREPISLLFMSLALPGHFIFYCSLVAILLSLIGFILRSSRSFMILTLLGFSLFQCVIVGDGVVFSLFKFHINMMIVNLFLGGQAGQILSVSIGTFIMSTGLVLLLVWIQTLTLRIAVHLSTHSKPFRKRLISALLVIVMLSGQGIFAYADASWRTSVLSASAYLPWPVKITMKDFLKKQGISHDGSAKKLLEASNQGSFNYPKSDLNCGIGDKPMNIVMLVIDSLRYDMLTAEVMPHSYEFAQSAYRLDDHYSTSNSTRFGIFGLFYGLPGNYWFPAFDEQKPAQLIEQLNQNNYDFMIYASASLSSPEFDRTVFASIPEQLFSSARLRASGEFDQAFNDYHIDRQINHALIERLKIQDKNKPFFAFAFYDAPHNFTFDKSYEPIFKPYLKTVNYLHFNEDYDATDFFSLYKNSVNYVDTEVKKVLDTLKQQDMLDNTIVIITGDHGQEFNENGGNYWGHDSAFNRAQVKVPMILHLPNHQASVIKHRSSHQDVAPTLLSEALVCDTPRSEYTSGTHLLDPEARFLLLASWSQKSILDKNRSYVFSHLNPGITYDLDYQRQDESIPPELTLKALALMSEFLQ